jgi:alanine racemase
MVKQEYQVLNEISISKAALRHNYSYFAKTNPQAQVAPVLKANAYGHGLGEIASFVDQELAAPFICVDSLYEAYELHKQGTTTPILIMGYTNPENFAVWKKLPFTFSVFDVETLRALNKHQPGAKIHIKLDTGMCRLGLQPQQIPTFIQALKECSSLKVEGIFSHLSQADEPKKITFTNRQIKLCKEMIVEFESAGFSFEWKHIAATAGASFIRDPYFNLIRLGLGFYGYTPFGPHTKEGRVGRKMLRPALTLTSHISQIKEIAVGNQVGYGGTYKAKQKETIAILPLGYNEGISRHLSNRGTLTLENGGLCPIIGNVCMNMTMIKLPRLSQVKAGDPIIVISPEQDAPNSTYRHAQLTRDIEYSMLTGLHTSIRRRAI